MINCLTHLSTLANRLVNNFLQVNSPCIGCLTTTSASGLCPACTASLPANSSPCGQCGLPLPSIESSQGTALCGPCIASPPAFDRVVAPWIYGFPINAAISRFKYNSQRALGRPLAIALASTIRQQGKRLPDALVPVPMHSGKLRKRGFNQAEEIAIWLSEQLDVPVIEGVLKRTRRSDAQSGLNRQRRLTNLKGAFAVKQSVPEYIALVDDVMTTGATVEELSRLLRRHGVKRIDVWVIARTPREPHEQ
ncbi:ComF family protein [Marinobacter sp. BGYM27]|uniref:ComF family protein n=1 Tax=Marinobacter sp. BGYM27 TaxID=2975597 RepID=UPI0021A745D3|nr:ComF family protein [Marinobacter sp. BGYM27]MDG5499300.1 ComF family protein [Marinobacter sp. BGYM27]